MDFLRAILEIAERQITIRAETDPHTADSTERARLEVAKAAHGWAKEE